MQAVILAAGKGSRLEPLTLETPKPMLLINGKPMLQIVLERFKEIDVSEVVIIVHHLKEKIISYFGDEFKGIKIKYVEQVEMKGTADALTYAERYITEDKFLCIAVDSLFEKDLLQRIIKHDADGVFTVTKVEDPKRYGVLMIDGKRVITVVEKSNNPPSNLANLSVYLFPSSIFKACREVELSERGEYELTDAIQILIDDGKVFEYEVSEQILDIGTPEQLKEARKLGKKLGL
jgi:dTDP-glucose pyrophosphorylase